jgi:flagellar hook-length control protein FliK
MVAMVDGQVVAFTVPQDAQPDKADTLARQIAALLPERTNGPKPVPIPIRIRPTAESADGNLRQINVLGESSQAGSPQPVVQIASLAGTTVEPSASPAEEQPRQTVPNLPPQPERPTPEIPTVESLQVNILNDVTGDSVSSDASPAPVQPAVVPATTRTGSLTANPTDNAAEQHPQVFENTTVASRVSQPELSAPSASSAGGSASVSDRPGGSVAATESQQTVNNTVTVDPATQAPTSADRPGAVPGHSLSADQQSQTRENAPLPLPQATPSSDAKPGIPAQRVEASAANPSRPEPTQVNTEQHITENQPGHLPREFSPARSAADTGASTRAPIGQPLESVPADGKVGLTEKTNAGEMPRHDAPTTRPRTAPEGLNPNAARAQVERIPESGDAISTADTLRSEQKTETKSVETAGSLGISAGSLPKTAGSLGISAGDSAPAQPAQTPLSNQIAEKIEFTQLAQNRQITVRLDPPELGKVHIQLQTEGAEVRGVVQVDSARTLGDLHREAPALLERLQEAGIQIKTLEFQMNSDARGGQQQTQQDIFNAFAQQHGQGGQHPQGRPDGDAAPAHAGYDIDESKNHDMRIHETVNDQSVNVMM